MCKAVGLSEAYCCGVPRKGRPCFQWKYRLSSDPLQGSRSGLNNDTTCEPRSSRNYIASDADEFIIEAPLEDDVGGESWHRGLKSGGRFP